MTREKSIKELEILKEDYWDDDGYGHEIKQYDDTILALEMAIKALEKQDRIAQILDDYDYDLLDTWEALKMVKEEMKK